jgi:hypothetical protein
MWPPAFGHDTYSFAGVLERHEVAARGLFERILAEEGEYRLDRVPDDDILVHHDVLLSSASSLFLHNAGECSQVAHKQIGFLHGGEVPTPVEFGPMHDVREAPVSEAADGEEDVMREDCNT